MEEREISDREFERGLQQVLGSHYEDLTRRTMKADRQESRIWEWTLWAAVYLSIFILALAMRG